MVIKGDAVNLYVKQSNSNKCQSFETVTASKVFITNKKIECRHGYFQEDTAVVLIKAEYDYDTKTYLVTLRDLYNNKDKFRVISSEEKFRELFRTNDDISNKYKTYREEVEAYYTENVKAFDMLTLLAMFITIIALIGGLILVLLMFRGSRGIEFISSQVMTALVAIELTAFMSAIGIWIYKLYIKYIRKKDSWGEMLETEQEKRETLAKEVEQIIKENKA